MDPPTTRPLRQLGRLTIVTMVLGLLAMWVYAFVFAGRADVPGRLPNRTFSDSAQPVCQRALDKIEALPKAQTTPDPAQRSEVVDQGSALLEAMVAELRTKTPNTGPERDIVTQWMSDWSTYIGDRRDYTAALRKDSNTRFAVTQSERDKTQITVGIDHFADVNYMPACKVPDDLS